jgi:hypothetical protein
MFILYWWLLTAVVLVIAIVLGGLGIIGKLFGKSDRAILLPRKVSARPRFLLLLVTLLGLALTLLVVVHIMGW